MTASFYIASFVAIVATLRVITSTHAIHALLYLVVSFLAAAVIFLVLGAPFAAALEVIIYAGAIMVLFVFVTMMLNPDPHSVLREKSWLKPEIWVGPSILTAILLAELVWLLSRQGSVLTPATVGPRETALALFGPYLLGVEMASVLLLAALVGAYHLGAHQDFGQEDQQKEGQRQ